MAESNLPGPFRRFQYTPSTSPWNNQFLTILWATQCFYCVFISILGGALVHSKINDYEYYDDGISVFFYALVTFLACGFSLATIGYTVFQYLEWKKNRLHPTWMVVMHTVNSFSWLLMPSFAWAGFREQHFGKWEASLLLDCVALIPSLIGLTYSCIVFSKWKKMRTRGGQVAGDVALRHYRYGSSDATGRPPKQSGESEATV